MFARPGVEASAVQSKQRQAFRHTGLRYTTNDPWKADKIATWAVLLQMTCNCLDQFSGTCLGYSPVTDAALWVVLLDCIMLYGYNYVAVI